MRALLVSQHGAERRKMALSLGSGWNIVEVTNGLDALREAGEAEFDLVVADETTVPLGAFGLARELKTRDDPPGMIVVLERPQDAWLARWSGADRWIVRPYDPFTLTDAVSDVTRSRRKTQPARRAT